MMKLFGIAAILGAATAQNASLPTVDLGYEVYRAAGFNSTGNFYNFANIRYAAPPVGKLRFAPPQAPAKNRDTINTGNNSRICPQASPLWNTFAAQAAVNELLGLPPSNQTVVIPPANASSPVPPRSALESEDCLFLDVYVPQSIFSKVGQKAKGAPVLVWIYGGGYTGGNKNYNPAGLLAASGNITAGDVIFVAFNYRLGALGWSSGPSFQAEGGTSNVALYDQRFALQWIQKNIHLFGGDKNRVTVFGESAGGGSIMHQITAYGGLKGKAPFQQAVPQSPGWLPVQSNVQQENAFQKLLNLTNTTSLAELRSLPTDALLRAAQQITYDSAWGTFTYGPVVDGLFAPLQPAQLLAQGRFDKDVKIMVGHNANEGSIFTPPFIRSEEQLVTQLRAAYPFVPQQSMDYVLNTLYPPVFNGSYPYTNDYERSRLIVAESGFTCNTRYLSTAYGNKTYSYLFAVPPAAHGQDVPYSFYTGGALANNPGGVQNRTIAIALQEFITSFAENGKPAAEGIRQFNLYGPNANVLKLNITGIDEIRDENANARCAWWQKALY